VTADYNYACVCVCCVLGRSVLFPDNPLRPSVRRVVGMYVRTSWLHNNLATTASYLCLQRARESHLNASTCYPEMSLWPALSVGSADLSSRDRQVRHAARPTAYYSYRSGRVARICLSAGPDRRLMLITLST